MRRAAVILLFCVAVSAAERDVIDELLRLPSPPPGEDAGPIERIVLERQKAPPDDAPLNALVSYWSVVYDQGPSNAVRERMIEAIESRSDQLGSFVKYLPPRADVCERVRRAAADDDEDAKTWLLHQCASERQRLVATVLKASDNDGYVDAGEEMVALAVNDRAAAEPVLKKLATREPRTRALALSLLFQLCGGAEEHRRALQSIATDTTAPGYARDTAIESLAAKEWERRDEWLLSLLGDPTLHWMSDGHTSYAPVSQFVAKDPDKWIPVMTSLLDSSNLDTRSLAANALSEFHLRAARADALRPLLPWISDPTWAKEGIGMPRLRIIQSVAPLGIREAIPHLVQVIANDPDDARRAYAAEALVELGDRTRTDVLRAALPKMRNGHYRHQLAGVVVASGGFSAAEMAKALEALVTHEANDKSGLSPEVMMYSQSLPDDVIVGMRVARDPAPRDDVASLVIARARELDATKPDIAQRLLGIVERWPVPASDGFAAESMAGDSPNAQTIALALNRRATFRANAADALRELRAQGGWRAGIATAIGGDPADARRMLAGEDADAQRALLAGARVTGDALPIDAVSALFGRTPALDRAAEAYLIANDSAAARAIVHARHPEIIILGSRLMWDPGHHTYNSFDVWERELLARYRKSGAVEVIALADASAWSAASSTIEIQFHRDKTTVIVGNTRRMLSPRIAGDLRLFLETTRFDDLGPLETGVVDGSQVEYVHLTRSGGRRVFMNNPHHAPGTPYDELVFRFSKIVESVLR